jgi:DNA-binding NarL/FixJ family response regulator
MGDDSVDLRDVLVVDDHAVLRDGIKLILTAISASVRVFEAGNAAQAIQFTSELPQLDLVLLDLSLPDDQQGYRTVSTMCELLPTVPVIVLSANEKTSVVRHSIQFGAKGFLPKSSSQQIMCNAIRLVLAGGIYLPFSTLDTTGELDSTTGDETRNSGRGGELSDRLTARQMEILKLIAKGKTNIEIAGLLGMSAATVRTHLTMMFKRLQVKNRTEAGHIAYKLGLEL